ncbi:hypothetical protein KJZ61_01510 [Candidatus Dependentiae bacterium]|nr:hypothetical protein [Candidatus Dependentiae bacterium]
MDSINFMDKTIARRYDITWWLWLSIILAILTMMGIGYLQINVQREIAALQAEHKHYMAVRDQLTELERKLQCAQDNVRKEEEQKQRRDEITQYHNVMNRFFNSLFPLVRENKITIKTVSIDQRRIECLMQAATIPQVYSVLQDLNSMFSTSILAISHVKQINDHVEATVHGALAIR